MRGQRRCYDASLLAKSAVYPLHERMFERLTFPYLEELERPQWLPRAELEKLQAEKFARLLRAPLDHSPWHADRIRAGGLEERVRDAAVEPRDRNGTRGRRGCSRC